MRLKDKSTTEFPYPRYIFMYTDINGRDWYYDTESFNRAYVYVTLLDNKEDK